MWPSRQAAHSANSAKATCACPSPPRGRICSREPRASSGSFVSSARRGAEGSVLQRGLTRSLEERDQCGVALANPAIWPGTVDQRPGIVVRVAVVVFCGFQHLPCPPLPLDARCVGRLPDEDHRELSALYGPEKRYLIPPTVPLQLGHLEGLEVDPAPIQGEEASVFVGQYRPLGVIDDLFEPG